ncbi:MAG: hypothetical protein WA364_27330, partial [Candidatus Nitrosopolaris sp.]
CNGNPNGKLSCRLSTDFLPIILKFLSLDHVRSCQSGFRTYLTRDVVTVLPAMIDRDFKMVTCSKKIEANGVR